MRAIDCHFHLFSSERLGLLAQGGQSRIGFSGTLQDAQRILDQGRITRILALASVGIELARRAAKSKWPGDLSPSGRSELEAPLEEKLMRRLQAENEWVCGVAREDARLTPVIFADPTVHEEAMGAEILDKVDRYGVKAIKIHPALDFVFPTHEGYRQVFELAESMGLVVIAHGGGSGGGLYDSEVDYCAPENFAAVLQSYPGLRLVLSHLAYPHVEPLVDLARSHGTLYTDLSSVISSSYLTDEELVRAIRAFGVDRVLFGSDFPYFDPARSLDRLLQLKLNQTELEAITWTNAMKLFALAE